MKYKKYLKLLVLFLLVILLSQSYYLIYLIYGEQSNPEIAYKNSNCSIISLNILKDLSVSSIGCRGDDDCVLVEGIRCPGEFCGKSYAINKASGAKYKIQEKMDYFSIKCTTNFEGNLESIYSKAVCNNGFCTSIRNPCGIRSSCGL